MSQEKRFRPLLIVIKTYAVVGPLILVVLIRGVGLNGDMAVHLLAAGYAVAFLVLLFTGFNQLSVGFRKSAYSSFVFAGVSLLWILMLLLFLPSLAS